MTTAMGEEAGIRVFMIPHCPFLVTGVLFWEALVKPKHLTGDTRILRKYLTIIAERDRDLRESSCY